MAQLFDPLRIKNLTLPNRFAMAPMTRRASPGGVPGPDVAAYYARRAAGGVGLIITEGVRIPHPAAGFPSEIPALDGADSLSGWQAVTAAVHAEGSAIAAQLWHQGGERDESDGVSAVSPSGITSTGERKGTALDAAGLDEVRAAFATAARNAKAVGFDAVELHGAHGYLLDEFLWDKTNLRNDAYGADRTRFPAEVVAAVRAAVGPDYPIIFRFSQWKANAYDARLADTATELELVLGPLVDAGVDVLHPSTRRHYVPAFPEESQLSLAGWTKKVTGVPVIGVGSVGLATEFSPGVKHDGRIPPAPVDRLSEQFEAGEFDIIAIGRALLADPGWVNRLRDNTLGDFAGYDAETALARLA
ncbi:NADH:flavin oxidoreductase [Mycolicibacterium canariasense]|uniref:NADH:flavin oxidoreductase n=1 Tax=Mycolicibacterium canariasense TaxID=228230 RepID=A0A100W9T7_MYCCR|nr:12-oxophytodienoate reductase [Mycolicibacterium canariasense]MCV7211860.1 12-oxophytodienoate reductase [Mycolicibacterium canariasense]ORU99915.1 12-oxophytodienoate reductase [Mycolicibacterium canariasense]GAS94180.1 NADH:flavin oxidoreductase [Mycolicibacterium canariasense]